jgi:hypothetical protein
MLRQPARTDADPRVRHRVDGLILVACVLSLARAVHLGSCSRASLRTWRECFLAGGGAG